MSLSDLAKYSITRSVARSICDSWASCLYYNFCTLLPNVKRFTYMYSFQSPKTQTNTRCNTVYKMHLMLYASLVKKKITCGNIFVGCDSLRLNCGGISRRRSGGYFRWLCCHVRCLWALRRPLLWRFVHMPRASPTTVTMSVTSVLCLVPSFSEITAAVISQSANWIATRSWKQQAVKIRNIRMLGFYALR